MNKKVALDVVVPHEQQNIKNKIMQIFNIYCNSEALIRPHFFLTGSSGSGKSFMIEHCCIEMGFNYFEINAAQLTKEGTSGNSLSKALSKLTVLPKGPTVCFVDEFDKLFISGNNNSDLAHETTNGVQNEFLKVLEGSTTSVFGDYGKYVECAVDHVLFVFAGAFNGEEDITIDRLRDFGIKTEFLGRVGLVYGLPVLSLNSLYTILQKSPLLAHYLALFENIKREDVEEAIMTVVEKYYDTNTLGVRLLNTLINQYFIEGGKLDVDKQKQVVFTTKMKL